MFAGTNFFFTNKIYWINILIWKQINVMQATTIKFIHSSSHISEEHLQTDLVDIWVKQRISPLGLVHIKLGSHKLNQSNNLYKQNSIGKSKSCSCI